MAKQKKKKKQPTNTTRKIDVDKYTPLAREARGVSDKQARKLYSEFRSIAQKRLNRLKEAGYANVDESKAYFPTLKEIDEHAYPHQYFNFKLIEVIEYLNNPLSLLSNQGKRTEIKTAQTLKRHGHEKASKNIDKFGKFMQATRARFNGLFYDSERAAEWYEQENTGRISVDELARTYEEWQRREDKLYIENMKLLHPKDYVEVIARKKDASITQIEKWIEENETS